MTRVQVCQWQKGQESQESQEVTSPGPHPRPPTPASRLPTTPARSLSTLLAGFGFAKQYQTAAARAANPASQHSGGSATTLAACSRANPRFSACRPLPRCFFPLSLPFSLGVAAVWLSAAGLDWRVFIGPWLSTDERRRQILACGEGEKTAWARHGHGLSRSDSLLYGLAMSSPPSHPAQARQTDGQTDTCGVAQGPPGWSKLNSTARTKRLGALSAPAGRWPKGNCSSECAR